MKFAAIDAGSNAIRLIIVRAEAPDALEVLDRERASVRLGHSVFTHHELEEKTIGNAVNAFKTFRSLMDRYKVEKYRAVATSAAREAKNREKLLKRIFQKTRIKLEVIRPEEEARLVRRAVRSFLGKKPAPKLIVDLGGGSFEINFLQEKKRKTVTLPLGAVRLMEKFNLNGSISKEQFHKINNFVQAYFIKHFSKPSNLSREMIVACGGNAERLAKIAPGKSVYGSSILDVKGLRKIFNLILEKNVQERIEYFKVRKDRAEVMGVASIVLMNFAEWFQISKMVVPGVGVREGIIQDLVEEHFRFEPCVST